jgi:hypothetical protein
LAFRKIFINAPCALKAKAPTLYKENPKAVFAKRLKAIQQSPPQTKNALKGSFQIETKKIKINIGLFN